MLSAIALNEVASCSISAAPPRGARAPRSPAASRCAESPTRRIERVIERASTSPAITAALADPAATARIFVSAPMWNMTQPESSTAASGTQTETKARPAS
jgi:hypothetical protein